MTNYQKLILIILLLAFPIMFLSGDYGVQFLSLTITVISIIYLLFGEL